MPEWTGIVNTTLTKYMREIEKDFMRNFKLAALLQKKGKIKFNVGGRDVEWRIRYKTNQLLGASDGTTVTFPRTDPYTIARTDFRMYVMPDSVSFKEYQLNKGPEAIVNRYENRFEEMLEDIKERFADEPYNDGNAAGYTDRYHGMESFLGTTGSAVSGSVAMAPSDTYAGLSTVLGNSGGTWTGAWPRGKGDPEYDFYSPLIVDYTSSLATASGGFANATATWAARCLEAMRFLITFSRKNKSPAGMLDFIDLDLEMFRLVKEKVSANERIIVSQTGTQGALLDLGYQDTINYDGVAVACEYGLPANVGYAFNASQVDLWVNTPQMWVTRGPFENLGALAYQFLIYNVGNFRWRPRYFGKLVAAGSSGA